MPIPTYTAPADMDLKLATALTEVMNVFLKRDYLLETEVDVVMDVPAVWDALTSDEQAAWTTYKSDLKAINIGCSGWPSSITWPTKPE